MNKKILWTTGAVIAGVAAAGAIGIFASQSKRIMGSIGTKNHKSSHESTSKTQGSINTAEDIPEEERDTMAEVVYRESGLYSSVED